MDIDDELELLQRQLMAVQQEKTNPLSQRTVAEIMVKLYHEGFAFIPTTDGNEYITPDKLDAQIAQLVRERGKIGISILPQLLNVSQDIVEARLNPVMQKWPITRHGVNLFSQKYFDSMVAGLAQRLQEEGRIDLENIAVEHELKMQFAQKLIAENLPKLKAELSGKQLITKQYTLLEKAKILGFLSAINNPLQIDILYKAIESSPKSAQKLVMQLLDEGLLKGRLANGYYIPDRFSSNQKRIVTQFLNNNGYLDTEMLQKKYMITKPDDWIIKNLGNQFVKIQRFYIKEEKLETYALQVNSQLKTQGFIELSHVLPLDLDERSLHQFLNDRCGLKDYFLCEGYVYSNQWLERLAGEFKHKIVQSIFFKKPDPKGKDSKKKGKKDKTQPFVTEEELQDMLFNGGYADYSAAETLATELLELITERLQQLKKKIQKQLAHSKGLISSNFLKYKTCKTILRTEQSLKLTVNIIQKQMKKTEKWVDVDFGPNQNDSNGAFSVLYYDNVLPKGWPALEGMKWCEVKPSQLLLAQKQEENKPSPMKKCMFVPLCQLINFHNGLKQFKLPQVQVQPLTQQSSVPFIYQFFISQKQRRYVLVDNLLPFVDGSPFGTNGIYSLAEKAYAKLRYCYKGIVSVGVHQMLLELTGRNSLRYILDSEKEKQAVYEKIGHHLKSGDFIVVLAEGEVDKKLILDEKQTEMLALHPYYIFGNASEVNIHPINMAIPLKQILQLFRNIFVIPSTQ